MVLRSRVKAWV